MAKVKVVDCHSSLPWNYLSYVTLWPVNKFGITFAIFRLVLHQTRLPPAVIYGRLVGVHMFALKTGSHRLRSAPTAPIGSHRLCSALIYGRPVGVHLCAPIN